MYYNFAVCIFEFTFVSIVDHNKIISSTFSIATLIVYFKSKILYICIRDLEDPIFLLLFI